MAEVSIAPWTPGFYVAHRVIGQSEPFCFRVDATPERNVWGLSFYGGSWGYRTYGIPFETWLERNPDAEIRFDRDRTKGAPAGVRARVLAIATATPRRRFAVHNVIAHPLLVLWPRVGERLHDLTAPGESP